MNNKVRPTFAAALPLNFTTLLLRKSEQIARWGLNQAFFG